MPHGVLSLKDVLKCVETMYLVQSVITDGIDLMHKSSVGNCEQIQMVKKSCELFLVFNYTISITI